MDCDNLPRNCGIWIADFGQRHCLVGGRNANWNCDGGTLVVLSDENSACGLGCFDSGAPFCLDAWGGVLESSEIRAAVSRNRRDCDLVYSTTGEAGMSLSSIPFTKLLEFSVPNSRAISIDSSITTGAGVPSLVIS
jgi:hypothetical protein